MMAWWLVSVVCWCGIVGCDGVSTGAGVGVGLAIWWSGRVARRVVMCGASYVVWPRVRRMWSRG